ncbi:hypothetical protein IWX88_001498 [Frigoribacterium sp. CG_9.8]|nr:hypothetical protein [Frigoribacterium sp. CG_9.8]
MPGVVNKAISSVKTGLCGTPMAAFPTFRGLGSQQVPIRSRHVAENGGNANHNLNLLFAHQWHF